MTNRTKQEEFEELAKQFNDNHTRFAMTNLLKLFQESDDDMVKLKALELLYQIEEY